LLAPEAVGAVAIAAPNPVAGAFAGVVAGPALAADPSSAEAAEMVGPMAAGIVVEVVVTFVTFVAVGEKAAGPSSAGIVVAVGAVVPTAAVVVEAAGKGAEERAE